MRHLLEKRSNLEWLSFAVLQLVKKMAMRPKHQSSRTEKSQAVMRMSEAVH